MSKQYSCRDVCNIVTWLADIIYVRTTSIIYYGVVDRLWNEVQHCTKRLVCGLLDTTDDKPF